MRLLASLVACFVVLLGFLPSAHAEAGPSRASVRRLIADGDLASARALLERSLASDGSRVERAAVLELLSVVDAWSTEGHAPPAMTEPAEDQEIEIGRDEDWEAAYSVARRRLLSGFYADAEARLAGLIEIASNKVVAVRAAELKALARALQPHSEPRPSETRPERSALAMTTRWYGWETLVSDGVALLVTPLAPAAGVGTYLLGGPIVHVLNGRTGVAFASLGVRVAAPVVGVLTGIALEGDCSGEFGCVGGAVIGGALGVIAATALDSALFARKRVPVEGAAIRFLPSVSPRVGGIDVGVAGTF